MSRPILLRFLGDASQLQATMANLQGRMATLGGALTGVGTRMAAAGRTMTRMVTLPMLALGYGAVKAAVNFESAFAGVRKTVDASEGQFAKLERGIRQMAKEIPASREEIAGVAEAAGQLGIRVPNILKFTRVMIDLGESTNLSSEQAATALARLANITGMPQKQFDRLGSTIVALGNNLATTEAEIVEMGLRLAGAGAQIGMTEAQIMGLAGAMSSVGIRAEAGGSAMSKVMVNIAKEVGSGGDKVAEFAKVAGMSSQEFSRAWERDAAGALTKFIEGLGGLKESGKDVFTVLDELKLGELRVRDALLRTAGAGDLVRKSLKLGTDAWRENTALSNEAAQRYATTESKLKILRNKVSDLGVTLGNALVPALLDAATAVEPLINSAARLLQRFERMSPEGQRFVLTLAGVAMAAGPVLFIIGKLMAGVGGLMTAFSMAGKPIAVLASQGKVLALVIKGLGAAIGFLLSPIGLVIAAVVAVGAALYLLWTRSETFRDIVIGAWTAVRDAVVTAVTWIRDTAVGAWNAIRDGVTSAVATVSGVISGAMETIRGIVTAVLGGIQAFWAQWGGAIMAVIGPVMGFVRNTIRNVLNVIKGIWQMVTGLIRGDWSKFGEGIGRIAGAFMAQIKNVVDTGLKLVRNLWPLARAAITKVWQTMWTKLREWAANLLDSIRERIRSAFDRIVAYFRDLPRLATIMWRLMWEKLRELATSMLNGIRDRIRDGLQRVVGFFRELPGKVRNVFSNAPTMLRSIGESIIRGLINGITGMVGRAVQVVKDAVGGVVKGAKSALGIRSPSRVFRGIGRDIMKGLAGGMDDGQKGVRALVDKINDRLTKHFNARYKDKPKLARAWVDYAKAVMRDEIAALTNHSRQREAVAKRLSAAQDRLKAAVDRSRGYAKSVRDSVISFGSITGFARDEGPTSSSDIVGGLRKAVQQAQTYSRLLHTLRKAGLNKTTYDQLVQAGVEGGMDTARALASGGSRVIREVNSLTGQLTRTAASMGAQAAKEMHGAGIQAAKGLVAGLSSQRNALIKVGNRLGRDLAKAARKALGIRSPSTVFTAIGANTAHGLAHGIERNAAVAAGAAQRMSDNVAAAAAVRAAVPLRIASDTHFGVTAPEGVTGGSDGATRDIVLEIDGREFARAVAVPVTKEQDRIKTGMS
ncbi:MAG TPA: phage tail tape measure protein [Egibacteraceae bacterium]|nr:phage tail tape measure protein [Egibacteraceae bacterium]